MRNRCRCVYSLTPKEALVQARCELAPDADIAPRFAYAPEAMLPDNYAYVTSSVVPVIVPVRIEGLEQYAVSGFEQSSIAIGSAGYKGGLGWTREKPLATQHIHIDRPDFAAIPSPTTIQGKAAVTVWQPGPERRLASINGFADVPGLGHCYSSRVEPAHGGQLLKVVCETPGDIPLLTNIRLYDPTTGQEWQHRLGDSYTDVRYPSEDFLSPLTRRQTFFHIVREASNHPGDRWTVPEESVARSQFVLSAFQLAGCRQIEYEIGGVHLRRHIAKVR